MFIKEVKKQNKGYAKIFCAHRLMESYRAQKGPRQRTILNIGKLDIPQEQWKILADRIEAIINGQEALFSIDKKIENLAEHYAEVIIKNKLIVTGAKTESEIETEYETVDLKSISNQQVRTIGPEYVGISIAKQLKLDVLFKELGFNEIQIRLALLSIVGKLVYPGSELKTKQWAQAISGIDELLNTDFRNLPQNALYRISDKLFSHKEQIEPSLNHVERELFSLQEKIILYDLTNTYFEGRAKHNKKAHRGRSKDKQKGRPLVTLGLVIDELGFPKRSSIFEGNVSEPKTLSKIIDQLNCKPVLQLKGQNITVVIDAGIASEDNLKFLKGKGYDYVCVARNRPIKISSAVNGMDSFITVKKEKNNKVEVKFARTGEENILYCKSTAKEQKEIAMKNLFQERFENGLKQISLSLSKKGGVKKYEKVIERIGRLKERYAGIALYYQIKVKEKNRIATEVCWEFIKKKEAEERFSGTYFLRTSRTDLSEKQLWDTYITLTNIEAAFRSLKYELNLRPMYHQKETRTDAHLFITVLAYHLLISIQHKLRARNINMEWQRVRRLLSTHVRVTTAITTKEGERIYIRNSSIAESFHKVIYDALGLNHCPLHAKRINA